MNTKSLTELKALSLIIFNDKRYEKINQVYAAEDGNVFLDENRAKIHKVKYYTITRAESGWLQGKDSDNLDEATKIKELQELELTKENYHKMKSLVTVLNIPVSDYKAETLIAALTEYKSKL